MAIACALHGSDAHAVDADRNAVRAARRNAILNDVQLTVRDGDLFAPFADEQFDLITANPPYLPTPPIRFDVDAPHGIVACDGGWDGRVVIDRILQRAPAALRDGGQLLLVQSSLADIDRTLAAMRDAGLAADIAVCDIEPLGPISLKRLTYLRGGGFVGDELSETLAVVRGRAI